MCEVEFWEVFLENVRDFLAWFSIWFQVLIAE
jgi:hypothetical protein